VAENGCADHVAGLFWDFDQSPEALLKQRQLSAEVFTSACFIAAARSAPHHFTLLSFITCLLRHDSYIPGELRSLNAAPNWTVTSICMVTAVSALPAPLHATWLLILALYPSEITVVLARLMPYVAGSLQDRNYLVFLLTNGPCMHALNCWLLDR
jgi:hypothetical protein